MADLREKLLRDYFGDHYKRIMKAAKKKLVTYANGVRDMVDLVSVGESVKVWNDGTRKQSSRRAKVKALHDNRGVVEVEINGELELVEAGRVTRI